MLKKKYLVANIGVDGAEKVNSKVWPFGRKIGERSGTEFVNLGATQHPGTRCVVPLGGMGTRRERAWSNRSFALALRRGERRSRTCRWRSSPREPRRRSCYGKHRDLLSFLFFFFFFRVRFVDLLGWPLYHYRPWRPRTLGLKFSTRSTEVNHKFIIIYSTNFKIVLDVRQVSHDPCKCCWIWIMTKTENYILSVYYFQGGM